MNSKGIRSTGDGWGFGQVGSILHRVARQGLTVNKVLKKVRECAMQMWGTEQESSRQGRDKSKSLEMGV